MCGFSSIYFIFSTLSVILAQLIVIALVKLLIFKVSEDRGIETSELSDSQSEERELLTRHFSEKGKVLSGHVLSGQCQLQEGEELGLGEPHDAWLLET